MARESDFDLKKRQREREDEQDAEVARRKDDQKHGALRVTTRSTGDPAIDKLLELFARAEPLIDQVNALYGQYIAGVESLPPLERRGQLDQLMLTLQTIHKPTAAYQFRFNSLQASYLSHRDRWDRMCKNLESGKITRPAGPKRRG